MRREDAPEAICVFDTETSGVDITRDRILTAYAMIRTIDGRTTSELSLTLDPGVEVPEAASEINGLTTEFIRANGTDARKGIYDLYMFLSDAARGGIPIVAYNMPFDLGILSHEVRRHFGFDTEKTLGLTAHFFDPFVYDVGTVEKRRGNRKLMTVAGHYGIPIDESRLHEAKYDVEVAGKLAWLMLQQSPHTIPEMQELQVGWRKRYADNLTAYFARVGKTEEDGKPIIADDSFPWDKKED